MVKKINRNMEVKGGWTFDNIADEFEEHVRRSVPSYDEGHYLIQKMAEFFLPKNASVLELGCSTGLLVSKFLTHFSERQDIRYEGVDVSKEMILACKKNVQDKRVKFSYGDATTDDLGSHSIVISYYTIQFIHPAHRQEVINKIYESLDWGGAFMLFEKVRAPDARFQDITTQIYTDFKRSNEFTDTEILDKSSSLKSVLEPFSTQGNLDMLKRAGFVDVMTIFKYVNFEGFLAIK